MLWLSRPPYLRWIAAVALLAFGLFLDLSEGATTPYPFAAEPIAAGATLGDAMIEWRDVPIGLLGPHAAVGSAAARSLDAGDPLTASSTADGEVVPIGWWSVPLELPDGVVAGGRVRLVATDPPVDTEGVVTAPPSTGAFAVRSPGLVAVAPEDAGAVAEASLRGALVVLIATG